MKTRLNRKTQNAKNNYARIYIAIIILLLICIMLYFTNALYYSAYTIDYLMNRQSYDFKEESQYKDNKIVQNDGLLTAFMRNHRNRILDKMPVIKSEPLPELNINEMSKQKIHEISHNFTKPFVIRGLIKDFDCVKKWDLDYFEKEYGEVEVPSFIENVKYSKDASTKIKQCNGSNYCSIKEICKSIKNGEPLYINNISKLFTESDKAREELNLQKLSEIMNERFLNDPKNNDFMSQLFLGGKNTGTSLHCASNINFFFNIKGTKHWGFIDQKYTHLINCQTSSKGLFAVSSDDFFLESEKNAFLKIPRYETVLNAGDFLFNPAWYWHAVKNKSDYTIAVANRYMSNIISTAEIPTLRNNYFFTFLQLFSPSYYMKFFFMDNTKSLQYNIGSIVDQEIINNAAKKDIL